MAPSSKRLLPWSSSDGGELSRPRKRWRSLVLELRGRRAVDQGVFGFRGMIMGEEFMTMLLPVFGTMVRRVVSEEVEKAIFRQFNGRPEPPRLLVGRNQRPRYQLMFLNGLKSVYTMMKLEAKDGSDLKVSIVEKLENNQTCIVSFGQLSSAKVEVVVLHGNFNAKNEEYWTPEEFNKHIVCGREKSAQLLTGNLILKLNGGEALIENATFTDNSSFTSTKKFRLGLRLVNNSGDRILEGITEPFRVKERRVEVFEKHYPPLLDDKVWRLQKIGRDGAYHEALSRNGIDNVQLFLQSYVKNEQKLKQTFSKMPQAAWKAIIGHAMTCDVGNTLYLYEVKDNNVGLFFNAIHQLVGVKFGDCYKPIDKLNQIEKNLVETMKQVAYENMNSVQYDHMMDNNYPPFSPDSLLSTESSKKSMLPTDAVMALMQSNFQLQSNRESFSNQLGCTDQTSHQFAIGFQPSRTNSFDPSSCEQLIQNFMSQISSSEGTAMPLSARNWVKIKAALKLASVGRLSRASRRGAHRPPARTRLVPIL